MMGQYTEVVESLRSSFASGKTKSYEWRIAQLTALLKMFQENEEEIYDVLYKDLHKPRFESSMMDIGICTGEIIQAINTLDTWMKPDKVNKGLINMMDTAYIHNEPFGVALVIGAWNYPFQISLLPLVGAIAAGNCAIVKPPELAEHSAKFIAETVPKYIDQDCIKFVTGGIPETTALLEEKFDIIFYTGNGKVGKIIMSAAAKHLTPTIMELGGKSPVYIDEDVDLKTVAKRVSWGKFTNSGQTCIAPDYVLCTPETQEKLIPEMKAALVEFYTDTPQKSDSYARILNKGHYSRLQKLKQGSTVAVGGEEDEADKFISPTVLRDVKLTDSIMQEEIFGPLLPIVTIKDHNEAIQIINSRDKPLALYVFTNKKKVSDDFLNRTSSGGFLVNDTMVHFALDTLPFGGVGGSGYGSCHGKFSFDAFSHQKAVLKKSLGMDKANFIRYPPFSDSKLSWAQWILTKKVKKRGLMAFLPFMILGTIFAMLFKVLGVQI